MSRPCTDGATNNEIDKLWSRRELVIAALEWKTANEIFDGVDSLLEELVSIERQISYQGFLTRAMERHPEVCT
jgi:hypothetical protein